MPAPPAAAPAAPGSCGTPAARTPAPDRRATPSATTSAPSRGRASRRGATPQALLVLLLPGHPRDVPPLEKPVHLAVRRTVDPAGAAGEPRLVHLPPARHPEPWMDVRAQRVQRPAHPRSPPRPVGGQAL